MNRSAARRFVFILAICACCISARAAREEALLDLWEQHMGKPDDHEAAIKACQDFAAAHAGDPLLPVARGFEEWHKLRLGRRAEVLQMFSADLNGPAGPVEEGARRIAQGWLTRADRDDVAAALQMFYRKQVAYPKSLDQLPADARPPMNDRFGKPWIYTLTGFAKVPGFTDQKHSLVSPYLGDVSDFKAALKLPYAARLVGVPQQVQPGAGALRMVKFNLPAGAMTIGAGQASGDFYVAFVGSKIIVVCDYTHWRIFPVP